MRDAKLTFLESVGYAIQGIKIAIRYNRNIRIHIVIAILVIISAFLLGLNQFEKAIICMIILLVISAEMINTAIEEVVDLVTKDYREEAKYAKDVSAGMVLIVASGSIAVGFLVFTPHILKLIFPN